MALFVQLTISALSLAGIYAMVAFGIQLVYGLTNLVNFAHGAMMTLGAYLFVASAGQTDRGLDLNVWLAAALSILALGVVGLALERFVFRRTLKVPISGFIVSLGVILVLENAFTKIWSPFPISSPPVLEGSWTLRGAVVSHAQVFSLATALVTMAGLVWWITFSRYGRALRACAEDREMAQLLGVPAQRMISVAFAVGTAAAGLAGVLLAIQLPTSPHLGTQFVIAGFTVALIGGLGSIPGALLGAVIVGAVESYGGGYLPSQWTVAYVFALLLIVLLVRPNGLLGGLAGEH